MISPWLLAEVPFLVQSISRHATQSIGESVPFPQGDGHPIIIYPGFTAGNPSMAIMRKKLQSNGHNAHAWSHLRNRGMNERLIKKLVIQARDAADESGQAVSLVGHSLGGTIARAVANIIPEYMANVVAIGSPINNLTGVLDVIKDKYDLINHTHTSEQAWEDYKEIVTRPLVVPCTSIWTKSDAIVPNEASIVLEPLGENVEATGGHFSMAVDSSVIYEVAVAINKHS